MRALSWHGTKNVQVDTVDDPIIEASGDVLIEVTATAIRGSGLHMYGGFAPMMEKGDILGHEFAGRVIDTGKDMQRVKKDDRQDALTELDEGKSKEALASLERATGKLEIVLAREPKLALLPIAVRMTSTDLYATVDTVRTAKQRAERLLRDGDVQAARAILGHLASEAVISTTNLPVSTYPGALKTAAKLIDENKIPEAKQVLQTALDTLAVTDVVIPLPVARAKGSLARAESLAKMTNRTAQQNQQLSDLVTAADTDIKYAEELGYGKKNDFDSFHKEIEAIRAKTDGGNSGIGFFDQIKNYIDSMNKNSQHTNGTTK